MHVTPHKVIFNFFKRTIYSKGLKLSEVVYLFVAEILIHVCQLYVHEFFLHNSVFLYSFPLLFLLRSCVMSHVIAEDVQQTASRVPAFDHSKWNEARRANSDKSQSTYPMSASKCWTRSADWLILIIHDVLSIFSSGGDKNKNGGKDAVLRKACNHLSNNLKFRALQFKFRAPEQRNAKVGAPPRDESVFAGQMCSESWT